MQRAVAGSVGFECTCNCATYQFGIRLWVQRCPTGPPLSLGTANACSFQKKNKTKKKTHTDIWELYKFQVYCCTAAVQTVTGTSGSQLVECQDSHCHTLAWTHISSTALKYENTSFMSHQEVISGQQFLNKCIYFKISLLNQLRNTDFGNRM